MARDVILNGGPHDRERLPLLSTRHKTINLVDGEQYFRMRDSWTVHPDGSESQAYLWTKYWDADEVAKRKAEKGS